jgi:hypothetical protein
MHPLWRGPLAMAGLALFGLLAALLGQGGVWWAMSWAALGSTLAVILWHLLAPLVSRRP